eukprot:scaffold1690_cov366-Prasinococcus_capsulatus_cf.AAC.5
MSAELKLKHALPMSTADPVGRLTSTSLVQSALLTYPQAQLRLRESSTETHYNHCSKQRAAWYAGLLVHLLQCLLRLWLLIMYSTASFKFKVYFCTDLCTTSGKKWL